ncbi:MAG: LytTR family DNA-binding domain-containing protein [Bacteroidota bacterium]
MNILILDDERNAREYIIKKLEEYVTQSFKVYEASSISEALDIIHSREIDVAFLDVRLNNKISFDLLTQLDEINFKIIFISGHDEYAIRAFRFNAIDYLVKPINPLEFKEALTRIDSILPLKMDEVIKLTTDIHKKFIDKIILRDMNSIYFIRVADIEYCKAEGSYTKFYINGSKNMTMSTPIRDYEKLLSREGFFRIHRSYLVNLDHVKSFRKESGEVIMTNKDELPLSNKRKEYFLEAMLRLT